MSDIIPTSSNWNALRRIVKLLPTHLAYYGSALGAIVLAGGGQLPPGLEFVAGSVGGNMLSNVISDILKDKDLPDDEVRQRTEEAIAKSDITNLLTKQDFLQGYARLIQRLDAQKNINQDILIELQKGFTEVASADQVGEIKHLILQLMQQPPQVITRKARLFISYARADDEPFAERLYQDLKDEFDVWWDREMMSNRGKTFLQEIRDAIDQSDRLLLVAGSRAFTSDYVCTEWQHAYETYKAINIALRLGDYADIPIQLRGFDTQDFRSDADYDEKLATLKRQLAEPVAPFGTLHNVPALPPHFLNRPDALDALRELVIADVDKPTLISAEKRTTAIEGMGGIGKSVLAAAFAHDRKVRFAFPDGIVWLTAGRDAKLHELYRAVGITFGDELGNYPDETTARQNAQKTLADKKCLLILDDVWELPIGRAFRDLISGTATRLVITTRKLQLNDLLNANEYRLKLIDKSQAGDYLRSWVGNDQKLDEIAEKLGYLFLALKLAGARMKKDNLSGEDYLRTFDRVSRMKIVRNTNDREDSLEASITLSVDAAFAGIEDDRLLYHTFGIFQEDVAIPQQTILQLWKYLRTNVDEFELLETLNVLVDLALVERDADNRSITLHDLLHNYTREMLGDRYLQTHKDLLNTYRKMQLGDGWHTLLNDGYIYVHLGYHLIETGFHDELYYLLTNSVEWLDRKFHELGGNRSFVMDLELALTKYLEDKPDAIMRSTVLWTVWHIINFRINSYLDLDLQILVLIDKNIEKSGRKTAEAINAARLRPSTLSRIEGLLAIVKVLPLEANARNSLLDEALSILGKVMNPDNRARAVRVLSNALASVNRFTEARELIRSIEYSNESNYALGDLAILLTQANRFDDVWDTITAIKDSQELAKVKNTIANYLETTGQNNEAIQFRGKEKHKSSTNKVLHLIKKGRFDEAYKVACNVPYDDLGTRESILVSVVTGLAEANRFDDAYRAVSAIGGYYNDELSAYHISDALYNIVAVLLDRGNRELLDTILIKARQAANNIEGEDRIRHLSRLAVALVDADHSEAKAILSEINLAIEALPRIYDRVRHLKFVAADFAKIGKAEVYDFFLNAHRLSTTKQIDDQRRAVALKSCVKVLAKVGYFDKALLVLAHIRDQYQYDEALVSIVTGLANTKRFKESSDLINLIKTDRILTKAAKCYASALAKAERTDEAFTFATIIKDTKGYAEVVVAIVVTLSEFNSVETEIRLDEAIKCINSIIYYTQQGELIIDLIPAFANIHALDRVRELANGIKELSVRVQVLSKLAIAYVKTGQPNKAEEIFSDAKQNAEIGDVVRRVEALCAIASALNQTELHGADNIIAEVRECISHAEYKYVDQLKYKLFRTLTEIGYLDEANQMAESHFPPWNRDPWRRDVAVAFAKKGQYDKAYQILEFHENERERTSTQYAIASTLVSTKRLVGDNGAVASLSLQTIDSFLNAMAEWSPAFEAFETSFSIDLLRETTRIAGWVDAEWQEVHELLK